MAGLSSEIIFDYVSSEDLPSALKIEQEGQRAIRWDDPVGKLTFSQGYPPDEAATEASFKYEHVFCSMIGKRLTPR